MSRILLVGVARSGTTWVGTVLSKCKDTIYLNEPDDERRFTQAMVAKKLLTRYPNIAPGDSGRVGEADITPYSLYWSRVWSTPGADHLLVKSVFVPFCLEWLQQSFEVDHVVWVRRDLPNVIASWAEYSREKHPKLPAEILLRRLTWQAVQQQKAYERLARLDFFSAVVDHLALAREAEAGFAALAEKLGLIWSHEAREQLADLATAGVGGHYGLPGYSLTEHISRTADQIGEEAWAQKVTEDDMAIIEKELNRWT